MESLYNLGVVFGEQGHKNKAIFMYESAIQHNAHIPEMHNNLGVLYKELGREEKALQCYQNALAVNPNFALVSCLDLAGF